MRRAGTMDERIVIRVGTAQRHGGAANRVDGLLLPSGHESAAVQTARHGASMHPSDEWPSPTLSGQSRYARLPEESSAARVAESVDAEDSKSSTTRVVYEFESRPGYLLPEGAYIAPSTGMMRPLGAGA